MRFAACIALLTFVLPMNLSAKERGVAIDQIIAVVGAETITESELRQESRIALAFRKGEVAALTPLDAEVLVAFRDYIVNQMVVAVHVRRLGTIELPRKKIDGALQKFKAKFRSPSAYDAFKRRFDISEEKIRSTLRRELRNQIFIEDRLRSRQLTQRFGGQNKSWSEEAMNTLFTEMKQTVQIRFLGPDQQLEIQ
ncbi:MAG: hypothetical protein HOI23_09630 [Deltaproteobacteria bacterium]|nr:hypothetical protein [Deltaproteobacteria bacterium]MBT6434041.1 hypothetical protein [Deltaproteobacteria bacterium]MBT6492523.1 hypothetical protein [Deltaproteobacteria bacterium]